MPANWWGPYVGIPFVDRGFGRAGCHCWGLVHLVYRECCGIELPQDGEASQRCDPWQTVTMLRPYDVVLMHSLTQLRGRARNAPNHVGLVTDPDHVLHTWQATGAVVMRRDHPLLRHKIVSFHRHEALQ